MVEGADPPPELVGHLEHGEHVVGPVAVDLHEHVAPEHADEGLGVEIPSGGSDRFSSSFFLRRFFSSSGAAAASSDFTQAASVFSAARKAERKARRLPMRVLGPPLSP